jgi:hypothetical protein
MTLRAELVKLEEQFWRGDAAYYQRHLAERALMVFADPIGVLDRNQVVASIEDSARWRAVRFDDVRFLRPADGVAILTYRANAMREGDETAYSALASSTWVDTASGWKLALHQQTPA